MNFNFDELKNPIDMTDQFDAGDIESNKTICVVACFPPLFFLPLLAAKDSAYGKFYANQGLITTIICLAGGIISKILSYIPIVGSIFGALVSLAFGIASIAAFVFTIMNATQGKAKPIPVIGQLVEIFK